MKQCRRRFALIFLVASAALAFTACAESSAKDPLPSDGDMPESESELEPEIPPTALDESKLILLDDGVYVQVAKKGTSKKARFFAIGFDTHSTGPWDGVSGANACYRDDQGVFHGQSDNAQEMNQAAATAGANFAYIWSVPNNELITTPALSGIWCTNGDGTRCRQEGKDSVPIIFNGGGEADMDGQKGLDGLSARFAEFKTRSGEFSPEKQPLLPSYEEFPYFAWHPTFRMVGKGDGKGESLTPERATLFARTTTMMIGDAYSYVQNRFDGVEAIIRQQKGPKGEGYEEWLAKDDVDHRSYFDVGFQLANSLRQKANPEAVVWMWLQGHAFNDDIGKGICTSGESGLWAMGPFPSDAYLRKEIASVIAAGATGIIFFGYEYCREAEAEKVRTFMKALASPLIYEPLLLAPRLDIGQETLFMGDAGYDGLGRAHLLVKWDAVHKQVMIIGANPGARATAIRLQFPFTVSKVERYDWLTQSFAEDPSVTRLDKAIETTLPRDEGFIWRLTPYQTPESRSL